MILDAEELTWQKKVTDTAARYGWTPYVQRLKGERRQEPSVVLVRGERVVVAYLRAKPRPKREKFLGRFDDTPGVETYVWCPADWPEIKAMLVEPG